MHKIKLESLREVWCTVFLSDSLLIGSALRPVGQWAMKMQQSVVGAIKGHQQNANTLTFEQQW